MSRAKTVLVTGAGRGIGRACVERFAAIGWNAVAGVRDVERARREYPCEGAIHIVALDVTVTEQVASGVAKAQEIAGGALDAVVNNAGYALMGSQEDAHLDDVRAMFETNLFGAAAVLQAALPAMRSAGAGVVVQISSIGARMSNPLLGFYHATKYGLTALSEALAHEVTPLGLRVHVVEPGMVATDFPLATRASGSITATGGPYGDLGVRLRRGFGHWRSLESSTADDVAEAVVRAATDPATPFRVVVGPDARLLDDAIRGSADFAAWAARLREFLLLDA
ncbi:MAG: SDR family NAD(P)-dependent oxidoreductase [Actinobacteria bacterium]|nr:SDR family NAD(P)-dependent oxidoreductase [Actinomycetota bacterium]